MKRLLLAIALACTAVAERASQPGWLGFAFSHHSRGAEQWLVVCAVVPGGPAATAGLQQGNVITAIDGRPLRYRDSAALVARLRAIRPGERLRLTIVRDGQRLTRILTAAPRR